MSQTALETRRATTRSTFARVLVGVDGSDRSFEAARQAAVLADGPVRIVVAYDAAPAGLIGGPGTLVPPYLDLESQRRGASAALEAAVRAIDWPAPPEHTIVRGNPWTSIIEAATRYEATVVAVGSHGLGRAAGIALGSVATELLHKAPCSVLVAQTAPRAFPRRIVVGVDGSSQSAAAYEAARALAERHDAELWPVVAHGGQAVDRDAIRTIVGSRREDLPDKPVDALVAASSDADLLVVGSRGLHGLKALGSVSERVGHRAHCSVLVVRAP